MGTKDDTRTEDATAASAAPSAASLPSRPECTVPVATSSTLGRSPSSSSMLGSSTWDGMIKRGGGMSGGGRPRGRGGYPRSSRGTYCQSRGSYGQASGSLYAFSQSRQQYHDRHSSWDSMPDDQQALPAYDQHSGRGRGGHHYNQQNATRRSYRGAGKSRGFWSRPRTYQPRLSYDQQQQDGRVNTDWDSDRLSLTSYTDHAIGTAAVSLPQGRTGNIAPQRTDSRAPVSASMMPSAITEGDLGPTMLDDAVSLPSTTTVVEPQAPAANSTPWPLTLVDAENTPPLVSDSFGDETSQSGHHQQQSSGASVPTSPTTPLHHQDFRFQGVQGVNSLGHPSHVPEMIYAWYPFPIVPGEVPGTPPPLPVHSTMPYASVPALHALPPRPPPNLYFNHDHAFLALYPPGPFVPITWWPIPYLQYWGPERSGEHPIFYDVPMFAQEG